MVQRVLLLILIMLFFGMPAKAAVADPPAETTTPPAEKKESLPEVPDSSDGLIINVLAPGNDPYLKAYNAELRRRIVSNWTPASKDKPVAVLFTIGKTGDLLGTGIKKSSGSQQADQEAIQAVEKSAPFPPLPSIYRRNALTFYFPLNIALREIQNPNTSANTAQDGPDFGPFLKKMQKRVRQHWHPPQDTVDKTIVLFFTIRQDGRLGDISVKESSGFENADNAAIQAVKDAAPFPHLPVGYKDSSINVEFTFDYNVYIGKKPD